MLVQLWLVAIFACVAHAAELAVHLDGFKPSHENQYVCQAVKLDASEPYYITGFKPSDPNGAAHHMILNACERPGITKPGTVWSCGEMQGSSDSNMPRAGQCGPGDQTILFAQAMGAGDYNLPEGVAFPVGKGTAYKYVVIQVHYGDISKAQSGDASGITAVYQTSPTPRLGGVFVAIAGGYVPPNPSPDQREKLDIVCRPNHGRNHDIVPFAFRTHAHKYGDWILGYTLSDHDLLWTPIAAGTPRREQTFYPIKDAPTIHTNETILARCVYDNNSGRTVEIGATTNDEMCNLYLMYYTFTGQTLKDNVCFTADGNRGWENTLAQPVPRQVAYDSLAFEQQGL